ncbi:MAG: PTS system mannose/fructose/sorbose family transporter subunit IID [Deltaproteobacteria bacterium]|jgi:PTS system mannose-specific IID component|nr:PTS system mannose/fructose/sorbose family transporter subunit IID [Deltaproteobacteria bacterium]
MGDNNVPNRELGWPTLLNVAVRSLFLEASWNLVGQQNLGFAAAVSPALRRLYQDQPQELAAAQRRVLRFFNTNPILSGLVIGAALRVEAERAKGLIQDLEGSLIISSLASTLAAHGDMLFWQGWLPLCCLLGFGLTWLGLAPGQLSWAPLVIPALFCALAWPTRVGGIFHGYRLGGQAHKAIKRFHVLFIARWAQRLTVFLTGFLTVYAYKIMPGPASQAKGLAILAIVAVVLFFVLAQRRCPALGPKILYLGLVLSLALTVALI